MPNIPSTLRHVIAEYAELFQERSKIHRILTEMPEGNSQALKTKRAEIFDIIKSLSARLKFLYKIFDAKGVLQYSMKIEGNIGLVGLKPNLSPGIYVIEISGKKQTVRKKISFNK